MKMNKVMPSRYFHFFSGIKLAIFILIVHVTAGCASYQYRYYEELRRQPFGVLAIAVNPPGIDKDYKTKSLSINNHDLVQHDHGGGQHHQPHVRSGCLLVARR